MVFEDVSTDKIPQECNMIIDHIPASIVINEGETRSLNETNGLEVMTGEKTTLPGCKRGGSAIIAPLEILVHR